MFLSRFLKRGGLGIPSAIKDGGGVRTFLWVLSSLGGGGDFAVKINSEFLKLRVNY